MYFPFHQDLIMQIMQIQDNCIAQYQHNCTDHMKVIYNNYYSTFYTFFLFLYARIRPYSIFILSANGTLYSWLKMIHYFKERNFREKKLSRFQKTVKFLHFAGKNFRGWHLMKDFAGINFPGEHFQKFHGNKRRPKSKFVKRKIRFYCTVLRWAT